ncbi:MAG: type II secretion system GspH family protein [Methylacidiphilales bacterium]|nr:type II secretion system GspH family protein [Candidatus Methylacidiphilales bacterium]
MNRAHPCHGIPGLFGDTTRTSRRGFTLLEMIMVLLIIALLCGLTMPSMHSAFTEQAMRNDAHQLALMVKTAMIQSAEQHRPYVIDLTDKTMALHPMAQSRAPADPYATASTDDNADDSAVSDVDFTKTLDSPNQLLIPDPQKVNAWMPMPPTEWVFQPGELCQATQVRLARGDAYLDMSFDALTGNVVNETYSLQ